MKINAQIKVSFDEDKFNKAVEEEFIGYTHEEIQQLDKYYMPDGEYISVEDVASGYGVSFPVAEYIAIIIE